MASRPVSDHDLVAGVRLAVDRYIAAVDAWEVAYSRYYRMPGATRPSDDVAAEQHMFDERRSELIQLLPRARLLCSRYNQPDVLAGLLRVSLGATSPQEGMSSALSRGERAAVMECLIEISVACQQTVAGSSERQRSQSVLDRLLALFR